MLQEREASLLSVLQTHVDRWGDIKLTMEELSTLTGFSRTTLWRSMTVLTKSGLVETTRTKRNFGKLFKNVYRLGETSTAGPSDYIDNTDEVTNTTKVLNTSYLIGAQGPEEEETMVNRWSEDDGGAAFGLLDEPVAVKKVSKRDPKTRYQRPVADWTAMDVASEFAKRTYDNIRGIPGMVNTARLMGALSANRAKFGITAEVEMKLMDKFFADGRNLNTLKKFPKSTHGTFLNFITNNIQSVKSEPSVTEALQVAEELEFLVASDGTKFDKSLPGRVDLAEYEKTLKKKQEENQ